MKNDCWIISKVLCDWASYNINNFLLAGKGAFVEEEVFYEIKHYFLRCSTAINQENF